MEIFKAFTEFLLSKSYKLIEDENQGRVVTYEHEGLFVQIVQDIDNRRFISLSRNNDHSWKGRYDMYFVRLLILNTHYKKDRTIQFDQLSQFFIDNYEQIKKAFESSNFQKTENAISILQDERAKAMFKF